MHWRCLLSALLALSSLANSTKASPVARPSAWCTNRIPSSPSSTSTDVRPCSKNSSCHEDQHKPRLYTLASPLPWIVPTGAKNAFIYLTVSAGPSDFLFLGADYKTIFLTYLLTYLHASMATSQSLNWCIEVNTNMYINYIKIINVHIQIIST